MTARQAVATLDLLAPSARRPLASDHRVRSPSLASRASAALERYATGYEEAILTCIAGRPDLSPTEQIALATCILEAHVNFTHDGTVLSVLLANPTCTAATRAAVRDAIEDPRAPITPAQRREIAPYLGS